MVMSEQEIKKLRDEERAVCAKMLEDMAHLCELDAKDAKDQTATGLTLARANGLRQGAEAIGTASV